MRKSSAKWLSMYRCTSRTRPAAPVSKGAKFWGQARYTWMSTSSSKARTIGSP